MDVAQPGNSSDVDYPSVLLRRHLLLALQT